MATLGRGAYFPAFKDGEGQGALYLECDVADTDPRQRDNPVTTPVPVVDNKEEQQP